MYKSAFPREGLPDCGNCRVANAYHRLDPSNLDAFHLSQRYLEGAITNPFPMATEPILLLDLAVVRFLFEAEGIERPQWSEYIDKFQAIHRAKERARG